MCSDYKAVSGSPSKRSYEYPLKLAELEEVMNKRYAQNSERKVQWAMKTYSQ